MSRLLEPTHEKLQRMQGDAHEVNVLKKNMDKEKVFHEDIIGPKVMSTMHRKSRYNS